MTLIPKDHSWHATWLDDFYTDDLRPFAQCFQPVMKLVGTEAVTGRTRHLRDVQMMRD